MVVEHRVGIYARGGAVRSSGVKPIRQYRRDRAAGGEETAFRKFFRRDLHQGLVRNLTKVGVLSKRIAPDLEALGISLAAA